MILKDTLKRIAESQKEELKEKEMGVKRELLPKIDFSVSHALILTGIRRCGKSTLLRQLMRKHPRFNYFNFEDPRVARFELSDFEKLKEVLKEINRDCDYYFFDEIQNVLEWERFVRGLLDSNKKCILTGSNASLLSRELGTKLTGRHLSYELFPFSYKEWLEFSGKKSSVKEFESYFKKGGFPEYVKYDKIEILQNLFNDILYRDIIVRHKLKDDAVIKKLAVYLLTNVGKEFSYNNLAKIFAMGSVNTALSYINFYEDSYMVFTVPKFDYSLAKQVINQKKVYSIDAGFSYANSVSFSEDAGRILENIAYMHLRRKYLEIFYFKESNECDFIVKEREKIKEAIQVCYALNEDNKEREINGLKDAMEKFHLSSGTIVTWNQEDTFDNILVLPAWKWLLNACV
jgi:predicted AAA+ superfamily ATPase